MLQIAVKKGTLLWRLLLTGSRPLFTGYLLIELILLNLFLIPSALNLSAGQHACNLFTSVTNPGLECNAVVFTGFIILGIKPQNQAYPSGI